MSDQSILSIEAAIGYIEGHLEDKLELETVAEAVHYSKYHLHRQFSETTGMTIHDYIKRRQLTEGASLLAFSEKPILEIALVCGYESQQAFSSVFKAMYKQPPGEYRDRGRFYPLQLPDSLRQKLGMGQLPEKEIRLARKEDIPDWMDLMRLAVDGYPVMDEADYRERLKERIGGKCALLLRDGPVLIGALAFDDSAGWVDFLGVHPQYRSGGIQKLLLDVLRETYLPGTEISITTYREKDRADTGHRALLKRLGFEERELLTEFGYPTQRFVLPPDKTGGKIYG